MRLLADLHTHTIASGHAYSTLTENVRAAAMAGLELIAITDHGPSVPQGAHPWYFWNLKVAPSVLDGDIEEFVVGFHRWRVGQQQAQTVGAHE